MTLTALAIALVWAGTAVAVLSALRLAATGDAAARLHASAPVTVAAVPLLIAGLALLPWSSWHDVAKLAVIAVLLAGSGPAAMIIAGQAVRGPAEPPPPGRDGTGTARDAGDAR
ncbi:monovalent cation/H(+) antiporter subunit G [Actinomadura algeriensis]|uniref:Multisubunit Na+/H+ antiporter MnhG subunit n=1 Tax=Actinomadura algeriensis TaxID=1679523 RepID=A0ABR9K0J7_9ACTN|nr:monovalent cation/H(+) antiporter subunit G [Actinomadura algeriensis]MBE1536350.1 multisubunit Na+/H+ antiporter MnhG subunit [Actinomadura algeriensis]